MRYLRSASRMRPDGAAAGRLGCGATARGWYYRVYRWRFRGNAAWRLQTPVVGGRRDRPGSLQSVAAFVAQW